MLKSRLLRSLPEIPPPALTVSLDTNRAEAANQRLSPAYMICLRSQASALAGNVPLKEKKLFLEQLAQVEGHSRTHRPRARGLAIFAGQKTWGIVLLCWKVRNELFWGPPPFSQILWLMHEHRSCGIVGAIRKGARFYLSWLGELIELEEKEFWADVSEWRKKDLGKCERTRTSMRPGIHKTRGSQRDFVDHRMNAQHLHFYREVAKAQTIRIHPKAA